MSRILYNPTFSEIKTRYKRTDLHVPIRRSVEFDEEKAVFLLQVYPFLLDRTPQPVVEPPKKKDIPKAIGKKIQRRIS